MDIDLASLNNFSFCVLLKTSFCVVKKSKAGLSIPVNPKANKKKVEMPGSVVGFADNKNWSTAVKTFRRHHLDH